MKITLEVKGIVSLILALVIANGSVTSGVQKYKDNLIKTGTEICSKRFGGAFLYK